MKKLLAVKDRTEQKVADSVNWHPNVISTLKLILALPVIYLLVEPGDLSDQISFVIVAAFVLFGLLDYLDGVIAKHHNQETQFGRYYDRITDYPLLLVLGYLAIGMVPVTLIVAKILLDSALLYLYARYRYYSYNRLRTGIHYITLFILLINALDVHAPMLSTRLATAMLLLSCFVNIIIILVHIGFLKKRYIADSLSLGNLLCGGVAIYMAYHAKLELSILFLLIGALFDGLDGYAARKYGSTKFGVYSDDIADGFTYGISPAIALMIHFYQFNPELLIDGIIIGCIFIIFTISRLVFFTLNKSSADPNYFLGAPSTLGGIVVLSSCYLFKDHVSLIAMFIGVACILMVSFSTQYHHLGRLVQKTQLKRRFMIPAILLVLVLVITGHAYWLVLGLFALVLIYGFLPMILLFGQVWRRYSELHN